MHTLIIVDDHKHVIEGMKKFVSWNELDVEIIDAAYDGNEGLQKIKEKNPDIVITDITMPAMDGLSMIKNAVDAGVNSKFIIHTAYSEFEYAKEAMMYGVVDYIVKPALPAVIAEIVSKIVLTCDIEKEKQAKEMETKQYLSENMPMLTEKFIEEIFNGNIRSLQELNDRLLFLELDFSAKLYRSIAIQIDNYSQFLAEFSEENRQFVKFSIISLINEEFKQKTYFINFKGENAYCLHLLDNGFTEDELLLKLEEIIEKCLNMFNVSISFGVGEAVQNLLEIKNSYAESSECLKYKAYFGNGKVTFYKDIIHTQIVTPILSFYDRAKLTDALKMKSYDNAAECIDEIFATIRAQGYLQIDYIRMIVNEFLCTTINTIMQLGEDLPDDFLNGKTTWDVITSKETLQDMEKFVFEIYQKAFKILGNKANQRHARIIEQILEFIEDNYAKEISLKDLSGFIYLTPNYLSNIFTKHMGQSFNDYISGYRMEKAKELLVSGNYKVYEIVQMVGYKNEDYFRKLFKEYTGHSPSDYKS